MSTAGPEREGSREENRRRRRTTVMQAALEVIAEKGFDDTRMVDIAERAGMSAGHTLYYFSTRADVLMQALDWSEQRFLRTATESIAGLPTARARLWRLVELSIPETATDPAWILWLETWARAPHSPEVAQFQRRVEERWLTLLADVVREGQASGELAPESAVSPERFAFSLDALIDGLSIRMLGGSDISREELLGYCAELIDRELVGRKRGTTRTRPVDSEPPTD